MNESAKELINRIVLIRNRTNKDVARTIISRNGIPHSWVSRVPTSDRVGEGKLIDERGILVLIDRSSSFIEQFKHPKGKCYPFYKLTAYNNCNYWCEYCYLYLTFYMRPQSMHFVNYDKLFEEMGRFDRKRLNPKFKVLNLGELADPIAVDQVTGFTKTLTDYNATLNDTRLMFLTKGDYVDNLLNADHRGKVIVSWSVNSDYIAELFEHRTPCIERRIAAAKRVRSAGYEVRFRIDPIFKYRGWENGYENLVNRLFDEVRPSMITLGEYRPSQNLISHIRKRFPNSKLIELDRKLRTEAGKKRYDQRTRVQLYSHIIKAIRRRSREVRIALCKETVSVWNACGLDHRNMCCNCTNIT